MCVPTEPNHRCPGGPAAQAFARDLAAVIKRLRSEGRPTPDQHRYFYRSHLAVRVQLAVRRDRQRPDLETPGAAL